ALSAGGGSLEARRRAELALRDLRVVGIALPARNGAHASAADDDVDPSALGSTPYADLIRHRLLRAEDDPSRNSRLERILPAVAKDRREALRRLASAPQSCPEEAPFIPTMERRADLLFAERWPLILDRDADPDGERGEAVPGHLRLVAWHQGYRRLLDLAAAHHPWRHLGTLLTERGELDGLSVTSEKTYQRVTELAAKHFEALGTLRAAHPERFVGFIFLDLARRPGALRDPRLRNILNTQVAAWVEADLRRAATGGALIERAGTAALAAMSFPGVMQGPFLTTLRRALDEKLAGDFGRTQGWQMALVHAGHALIGRLFDDTAGLDVATDRIEAALASDDLSYAELGTLVRAAAAYARLAPTGALDPDRLDPRSFPVRRTEAHRQLVAAISALSPGDRSEAEEALSRLLADLIDGLIAVRFGRAAPDSNEVTCSDGGGNAGAGATTSAAAWRRLRQRQRRLLRDPIFSGRDDRGWARRTRLVGLLVSDTLDLLAPPWAASSGEAPRISSSRAETIVDAGLRDWVEGPEATAVAGGYLLLRGRLLTAETDEEGRETARAARRATLVFENLSRIFAEDATRGGLFATLAEIGRDVAAAPEDADPGAGFVRLLGSFAERAYARNDAPVGDLLLLFALVGSNLEETPIPEDVMAIARARRRPVLLPMLMHDTGIRSIGESPSLDPAPLLDAMAAAGRDSCGAANPAAVIAVRRAIHDFAHGARDEAVHRLDRILSEGRARGLVVPRQTFTYLHAPGRLRVQISATVSLGGHLLENSGGLQAGLGYGTSDGGLETSLDVTWSSSADPETQRQSARYYAHVAALTAAYHFARDDDGPALGAARTAVGTWANGVKLGPTRVPSQGDTATWTRDATATIAVIAQSAAERGHPLLAGDLWTLAKMSLPPAADDDDVAAVFDPVPVPLREVTELTPVIERAKKSLQRVAAPMPCTRVRLKAPTRRAVDCEAYPEALALRVADAWPRLPRLAPGAETGRPACQAWRAVDTFLAEVDAKRYDPGALERAVGALRQFGHEQAAATLMARQRHPEHCSPTLVDAARALSRREGLGVHLRADVLSVAANCSATTPSVDDDLLALDDLTRRHAQPARNFEVLLFAARVALLANRFDPLYALTHRPGFIRRFQRFGPDLGAAALLLFHASAAGAGKPMTPEATAETRRLVCVTYAEPRRAQLCNTIAQLTEADATNLPALAQDALRRFIEEAVRQNEGD
ncbi:MAG: hypothetical protein AAF928_02870, partial [Myxococcota bacterium]